MVSMFLRKSCALKRSRGDIGPLKIASRKYVSREHMHIPAEWYPDSRTAGREGVRE